MDRITFADFKYKYYKRNFIQNPKSIISNFMARDSGTPNGYLLFSAKYLP